MIERTLAEVLKTIVEGDTKLVNNSVCEKCSKCGECCTNLLPVCQEEIDIIQKYVIKNKIRPQKQMLVMRNTLTCPYYDGKKCLIYEVRPLICKEFYCYKKTTAEMARKFSEKEYITVDMWRIAQKIDKYFKE